ncbi:AbrB/MazE/SpoVT family DNA-binding domain-containing protein [Candidatus Bathyarchaeota archaeon]|nr:MAG: AbrB/MazE/SpoVT family DNA-binding domain-containing protein [Candidatus Bathyarchaeota archaeon]HDI42314.1 AbrB/MazE/SpoVT family DNA-binding domain-containing protein [Candidatus Bathyarchaeota archaeon]
MVLRCGFLFNFWCLWLDFVVEVRVGEGYSLRLPENIAKALGIKEGDRLILRLSGRVITIEAVEDPVELALHGEKFAKIESDEVEEVSIEEQRKYGIPT